jgi:hypothetical protein
MLLFFVNSVLLHAQLLPYFAKFHAVASLSFSTVQSFTFCPVMTAVVSLAPRMDDLNGPAPPRTTESSSPVLKVVRTPASPVSYNYQYGAAA